jgi:hypothetical protein
MAKRKVNDKKKARDREELLSAVEHEWLRGRQRTNDLCHILSLPPYEWDYTVRHVRGALKEVKERLRDRYEKEHQIDFQFIKENFMRLLDQSIFDNDKKEQRHILNDFMRLTGLDIQKVETEVALKDPEDLLKKMDDLLR